MNSIIHTHTEAHFVPANAEGERAVPELAAADLAFFTLIAKSPFFATEHAKHLFLDGPNRAA